MVDEQAVARRTAVLLERVDTSVLEREPDVTRRVLVQRDRALERPEKYQGSPLDTVSNLWTLLENWSGEEIEPYFNKNGYRLTALLSANTIEAHSSAKWQDFLFW